MNIKSAVFMALTLVLSNNINASTVVINELLPNATGADSGNEWIEFFNSSTNPVDMSGWGIQKATASYTTFFTFPVGTALFSGEYFVVGGNNVFDADINISQLGLGNAGSSGDSVRLIDELSNVIDTVIYGPNNNDGFFDDLGTVAQNFASTPAAGQSLARFIDGIDSGNSGDDFILLDSPTRGGSNNPSAVPLPAAAWLFGSGIIGLGGIARRKNNI